MNHPNNVPEPILEDFSVGELPTEQKKAVAIQLRMTPGGMERLAELRLSNEQILAQYPSHMIAAQITDRVSRESNSQRAGLKFAWPILVTGVVVVMLLLVFPVVLPTKDNSPISPQNTGAHYFGVKGEPQLIIHRKNDSDSQKMNANDVAEAGDLLQLMYNAGGLKYGIIFSYDGANSVTLHFPSSPKQSNAIKKGGLHSVAHSYELDDAPDFETFVFIGANKPLQTNEIIENVKRQLLAGQKVTFENDKIHTSIITLRKPLKTKPMNI